MSKFDLKDFLKKNKLTKTSKKLLVEEDNDGGTLLSEAKYEKKMRDKIVDKIGNQIGLAKMGTDSNFANTGGKSPEKIAQSISDLLGVDVDVVEPSEKVKHNSGKVAKISGTYHGVHFEYEDTVYNFKLSKGSGGSSGQPRDAAYYEMGICVEYNKLQGMDRKEAMDAADVEESKYAGYEEHLTEVCAPVAEQLPNMGSFLRQTGGESFSPSPVWPSSDGTPKTDIYGGPSHRVSVKKKGGSQLISGAAGDAKGIFSGGFAFYQRYSGNAKNDAQKIIESIEDGFKSFNTERTVSTVRKQAGEDYLEWRIPQIEEKARKLKLNLNKNDAERHAKAEAMGAGFIGERGYWEEWFIEEIEPISDRKIMSWFEDYWKSQGTEELQKEVRDIVSAAIEHKRLDDAFNQIFQDKDFKTWCVYEAASGNYKFSGDDDINSSNDPIANEILVFGMNGDVKVKEVDEKWSSKYSNKVSVNVSFKTSGRHKATAFRLLSEGASYDEMTEFEKNLNNIIVSEERKLKKDINKLFESYDVQMNQVINEISLKDMMKKMKRLGKKLLKKFTDKIKSFYNNVIKKVIDNLKKYASMGLKRFMEFLGIEADGQASLDIQF